MSTLSDAFLALPGGPGTLDELFEQWTWQQLGLHAKPCGALNLNGFFEPLRAMISMMQQRGFISEQHASAFIIGDTMSQICDAIEDFRAPNSKWENRENL